MNKQEMKKVDAVRSIAARLEATPYTMEAERGELIAQLAEQCGRLVARASSDKARVELVALANECEVCGHALYTRQIFGDLDDMGDFAIEITDTYAGEANYSWVRRYIVRAKSRVHAVRKLAKEYGAGWRVDYDTGDYARYTMRGACICLFVELFDQDVHADSYNRATFIE